jgi:hypothetical protein
MPFESVASLVPTPVDSEAECTRERKTCSVNNGCEVG